MTRLRRRFHGRVIDATALSSGLPVFRAQVDPTPSKSVFRVARDENEVWDLDTLEDFLDMYGSGATRALAECRTANELFRIRFENELAVLTVRMTSLAAVRAVGDAVDAARSARQAFRVFVGHGRAPEWRLLATHLRDQHKFEVVTYESLARLGEPATEVLERAARTTSVAVLVHSAEISSANHRWFPSANVAHETGFFSARLGFQRAIVVRDDRCTSFTNIAGLTHLRYPDRDIRETFDDVVAALRRLEHTEVLPNDDRE